MPTTIHYPSLSGAASTPHPSSRTVTELAVEAKRLANAGQADDAAAIMRALIVQTYAEPSPTHIERCWDAATIVAWMLMYQVPSRAVEAAALAQSARSLRSIGTVEAPEVDVSALAEPCWLSLTNLMAKEASDAKRFDEAANLWWPVIARARPNITHNGQKGQIAWGLVQAVGITSTVAAPIARARTRSCSWSRHGIAPSPDVGSPSGYQYAGVWQQCVARTSSEDPPEECTQRFPL
jgi:hypothetical protein